MSRAHSPEPATGETHGIALAAVPLAIASTSLISGLALGFAAGALFAISSALQPRLTRLHAPELRLPITALMLAGFIAVLDRLIDTYLHHLHAAIAGPLPLAAAPGLFLLMVSGHPTESAPAARPSFSRRVLPIVAGLPPLIGALRELAASLSIGQLPLIGTGPIPVPHRLVFPIAAWPTGGFLAFALLIVIGRTSRHRMPSRTIPPTSTESIE